MIGFPKWKMVMVILVCLLATAVALPNFVPENWMKGAARVNLGLDLRGGSYLLLKADFNSYMNDQLQSLVDDVRTALRKEKIGYKGLGINNGGIKLELTDPVVDSEKAKNILRDVASGDLLIDISDSGAINMIYREEALRTIKNNVLDQSVEIVRRRVDETGTREPIIQKQGEDRILVQVPGLQNPEHLKNLLGRTAKMTFHLMDENNPFPSGIVAAPPGTELLRGDENEDPSGERLYLIKKKVMLSGDSLVDARPTFDRGSPVVSFRFNNAGGRKFADVTKENVRKPFAIVLDNKVISAPVIEEPILGGSGIIRGHFTTQQVQDMSLLLRAGALPAPLEVLEERTVGPSLGQDSIDAGIKASILGIILVIIYMYANYGMFGMVANIALAMNIVLLLACLSFFQATLTMPGIAGIVLTMGMAVDANVLIYERIKEEVDNGVTPFAAVDKGFSLAFSTILDSNITTLIATFLLYAYGTGPVKGFAVTLTLGIICSMFTAIMISRFIISLWLTKKRPNKLPI